MSHHTNSSPESNPQNAVLESSDKTKSEVVDSSRRRLGAGLGVSAMKHNLKALGIIKHTTVRPPTRALDGIAIEELQQLVSDLNAND